MSLLSLVAVGAMVELATAAGAQVAPASGAQAAPQGSGGAILRGPVVPPNSSNALAGTHAWTVGDFIEPVAAACVGDGLFAVADASGSVRCLAADGGTLRWTATTGGGMPLVRPSGVAPYGDGALLVSDRGRIGMALLSSSDGSDLGMWPADADARSAWAGLGIVPAAIACAPGPGDVPRVAVADANAPGRIAVSEGGAVRCITAPFAPEGIALGADGVLVASSRDGHVVATLDLDGVREGVLPEWKSWGGRGPYPGLFNAPRGLCIAGPWILVSDEHNHRICRLDRSGGGKLAYGQHAVRPRSGDGHIHYPVAVAFDPGSGTALVCEPFERRVQAYRVNLDPEPPEVRVVLPSLEGVQSHFGPGAASDGDRLFLQDPESASVVVFDLSLEAPVHVTTLGMAGSRPHEFGRISALAAAGAGTLACVADEGARRVALWSVAPREGELRFDPFAGRLVAARSYASLGIGDAEGIADIAATQDGFALAVRPRAEGVPAPRLVLATHLLESFRDMPLPSPGDGLWDLRAIDWPDGAAAPAWIAARASAAPGTPSVIVRGGVPRLLHAEDPVDLACLADGRALVVDRLGDRLLEVAPAKESPDAEVVTSWGGRGVADGNLWLPVGVTVSGGEAIVVDGGNHRGQCFTTSGAWRSTFSLGRSYTRPRSEAEVLGLRGPRAPRPATAEPAAAGPGEPGAAAPRHSRPVPEPVRTSVSSGLEAGKTRSTQASGWKVATQQAVRSNGGAFWIRARISSDAPLPSPGVPPLRRPCAIEIEAFADEACTVPYDADAASVDAWMPHHRHGMNVAPRIVRTAPGAWRAEGMLMHMSGLWEVDVDLTRGGRSERAQWDVDLP